MACALACQCKGGVDRLHINLDAHVREESVTLEMQVLDFTLVRELLQNVVKHAGVNTARTVVMCDTDRVQEVGGRFSGDTAPGRDAQFTLQFPLRAADTTRTQHVPAVAGSQA